MSRIKLTFEPISGSDEDAIKLVMHWRNDVESRNQSFSKTLKEWPHFQTEFLNEYANDPLLPCFFAVVDGRRVAFLRFRRIKNQESLPTSASGSWQQILPSPSVDISLNVAPEERNKGLGKLILNSVGDLLKGLGIASVLAEVKPDNERSEKVFRSAGFIFLDCIDRQQPCGSVCRVNRLTYRIAPVLKLNSHRAIGDGYPCFIIAEAGSNWRMGNPRRDLKMAKTLISIAKESGADAVKFQTYRPETTYVSNAGESDYLAESGTKESIGEIFADLAMPYEMLGELATYCEQNDIVFMSSPFSVSDFDAINPWVLIHKIASYEIGHKRLLESAARSNKPLVLSTGACNLKDIQTAVSFLRSKSASSICLMQCTAKYPAPAKSLNLRTIPILKTMFSLPVGLSDHSRDPVVGPVAAVAAGANLIEKHFTVDKRLPGPDHAFALEPDELKLMVSSIRHAQESMGDGVKDVLSEEQELFQFARRGLQALRDIRPGEQLVEDENFAILRPGKQPKGASPMIIDLFERATAKRSIKVGEGIQLSDLNQE